MRGNSWAHQLEMPAADKASVPLDWSSSVFVASSKELPDGTITVTKTGTPPVVTLQLTKDQTAAITSRVVEWYVAESDVFAGNKFVKGRIFFEDQE